MDQNHKLRETGKKQNIPAMVVLDEPTAMLDPNGRAEVMKTITNLNREHGMTVLHITHYMTELVGADRIVVMDGGRVVATGTPREIFSQVAMLKEIGLVLECGAEPGASDEEE